MCNKRLSKCLASSKAQHSMKPRGGERRVGRTGELAEGETATTLDSAGADRLLHGTWCGPQPGTFLELDGDPETGSNQHNDCFSPIRGELLF